MTYAIRYYGHPITCEESFLALKRTLTVQRSARSLSVPSSCALTIAITDISLDDEYNQDLVLLLFVFDLFPYYCCQLSFEGCRIWEVCFRMLF